jgi:protein phosphatase
VTTEAVAAQRFDAPTDQLGQVWTRTGRAFFPDPRTHELVDRLRKAAEHAALFDELDSRWLLLDTELLPWSAKAEQLLRDQYAAVGGAARAALPAAVDTLAMAAASGLDVTDLLDRTRARVANATAFTDAYRRFCWPTDGLTGVQIAPFQLLATDGASHHTRSHAWHLDLADRLAAADPQLVAQTRRCFVDTTDQASVVAATEW